MEQRHTGCHSPAGGDRDLRTDMINPERTAQLLIMRWEDGHLHGLHDRAVVIPAAVASHIHQMNG